MLKLAAWLWHVSSSGRALARLESGLHRTVIDVNLKLLGDVGELAVQADLAKRGYRIAIPFGDNWDYDLLLCRDDRFERVQVKYTESDGKVVTMRLRTQSVTSGRKVASKVYTSDLVDWLAVYDRTTDACYYLPSHELGGTQVQLRLTKPKNGQEQGVRWAKDYTVI